MFNKQIKILLCVFLMATLPACVSKQDKKIDIWAKEIAAELVTRARNGDTDAMSAVGSCFSILGNYSVAYQWYKKAANLGNAEALNNLGVMYNNGEGVKKNYIIAFKFFEKAANLGCATAMLNLFNMYFGGYGVEKNHTKGKYWLEKAANLGNTQAKYKLKELPQ